ncbi:hypothetical protein LTR99_010223 [Exophiala xenobiotica]|uniref:Uncharacterized protein n=1 Tax=Vermiconidia calcicola TaxID=1690605 RepID=A0AAV9Q2P4_9PEZI|nr:hypothetical protein LTR92_007195 [Exophiala xenobiotica]KAK5533942.1 hypothetical protein LTR25_006922 [Vermiconidia calcicola]KAK5546493.1 hypothetical protein LTR23_003598 [Chaetothyriales sp. CCFEE 6169]KAK5220824.1 hypothetical protein LTR47_011134 [Exophiala xenobiotica]KAK5252507.1 hypothetical protein LTS06_002914 [Exophiala xenobiotica]
MQVQMQVQGARKLADRHSHTVTEDHLTKVVRCIPPLDTDEINPGSSQQKVNSEETDAKPVELTLTGERKASRNADEVTVQLSGTASAADESGIDSLTVYVDGKQANIDVNGDGTWTFTAETRIPQVLNHVKTEALVARDQVMAVVVAKSGAGIHSGKLLLL